MRKRNWLLIVALLLLVAAGGIGGSLYAQASRAVADFENSKPLPGAVLYDQEGQVVKRLGTGSVSVRLDQTPQSCRRLYRQPWIPRPSANTWPGRSWSPRGFGIG